MVESERHLNGTISIERHYYVTSLDADISLFAQAVREHWGIENGQHWVLDIAFREDEQRIRYRQCRRECRFTTPDGFKFVEARKNGQTGYCIKT